MLVGPELPRPSLHGLCSRKVHFIQASYVELCGMNRYSCYLVTHVFTEVPGILAARVQNKLTYLKHGMAVKAMLPAIVVRKSLFPLGLSAPVVDLYRYLIDASHRR